MMRGIAMHNELTQIDIRQMKEKLTYYRTLVPGLRDEVKRTREYGDLSENDEYRCAKREYNRNNSRIRYLENMIKTAVVVSTDSAEDTVGLFDWVEVFYPEDKDTQTVRIVTTLRNDIFKNYISNASPFGKALIGHKVGDRVIVTVSDSYSYPVEIKSITKGEDDPNLQISIY